jgi:hypothetical protein
VRIRQPNLRSGEGLNFFLPYGSFEPFTGPATLQIILKNDENVRFPRRVATCLASVFKTVIVEEDIGKSSVSLRDEPRCSLMIYSSYFHVPSVRARLCYHCTAAAAIYAHTSSRYSFSGIANLQNAGSEIDSTKG